MNTIWESRLKKYPKLDSNLVCDTLIVGGGIAGMWCAYLLTKAGQKVVVLEAARVGSGVTSGSSAILTHAQENVEGSLQLFGEKIAKQYLLDLKNAIIQIKSVIETEKIDCDMSETDFIMYARKKKGIKTVKKIAEAYRQLEEPFADLELNNLPFKVGKAISFRGCLLIDPLLLLSGLANYVTEHGGEIYENTQVTNAPSAKELIVGRYTVKASHFVIASHFPWINFPGFYFLKMYQSQNYSVVFEPNAGEKKLVDGKTYEGMDEDGFEYRSAKGKVLCCGPDVRTGEKPYHSKYAPVLKHLHRYFNDPKEIARFSAQDCITSDYLPYAGLYSNRLKNVYVVTGFNKWGMTNAYITASTVTEMILHRNLKTNIYDPRRNNFFVTILDSFTNAGMTAASLANNLLNLDAKKFKRIHAGQGAIVKRKGHRLGVYRDNEQKLHIISGICPHLGCSLKWNKDECSWDCPCHGSRFDIDGRILNNPSIHPVQQYKLGEKNKI